MDISRGDRPKLVCGETQGFNETEKRYCEGNTVI